MKTEISSTNLNDHINPTFTIREDYEYMSGFSYSPYTPCQIKNAYCFNELYKGNGQTIAIIDAYGNPNIEADLAVFNETYNLPPANLTIAYPQGVPENISPSWALETSLDVEWTHALAPEANILLVISNGDLLGAVDYAVSKGCKIVSMSFGSLEYPFELDYNYHFNVPGVIFIASSGDKFVPLYPATSPYVIAAGGTSLQLDKCGNRITPEIAWTFGGGGVSLYQPKPSWQNIYTNMPPTNNKTVPDISFFADAFPGVSVYSSIEYNGKVGFFAVGGTSVSAPCLAAIIANANLSYEKFYNFGDLLYSLAGNYTYTNPYNAYTDTKNGNNTKFACTEGYDYVTGLGSPIEYKFIQALRKINNKSK